MGADPAPLPPDRASIPALVERANTLIAMRGQIIREVNDLFATIAEVAENEMEGKYSAMIEYAARMQDARDAAIENAQTLRVELKDSQDTVRELRDRLQAGGVKVEESVALERLLGALDNIVGRPVSAPLEAKIQGDVNRALTEFRDKVAT